MGGRSVVFVLLAVVLVAASIGVLRCSGLAMGTRGTAAPTNVAAPGAAVSSDPILARGRVMLLTHAGAASPEGTRLLVLARQAAGGVMTPDQLTQFDADFGTLAGAGQASVASSPSAMIAPGESASVFLGRIGAAPASAFNLQLDLLATGFADGTVRGSYVLRVSQQSGAIEVKLAELGLPVGDRGVVGIEASAASGGTLLGLRELPASSDLGAAIMLLIAPQVVPTAPTSGPPSKAAAAGGGDHDSAAEPGGDG